MICGTDEGFAQQDGPCQEDKPACEADSEAGLAAGVDIDVDSSDSQLHDGYAVEANGPAWHILQSDRYCLLALARLPPPHPLDCVADT